MVEEEQKQYGDAVDSETNEIARMVVDSAFQVHSSLGPGLLESVYEACLEQEMLSRGLKVERQVAIPLVYKDVDLSVGFRIDLLVENKIVLEIKAVEELLPVHQAQVITYLKLSKHNLGFLINFNKAVLKTGIKRIVLSDSKIQK